jgi:enamine deaminase RidA (YjgF/YER057c/UK114 family)
METLMQILQPEGWAKPRGYSNGIVMRGRQVFIAGQIGWDAQGNIVSDDLAEQTRQALGNVLAILAEAGGKPEQIARLTWYITDKADYLASAKQIGAVYRELMGRHYPAMSMVQVVALMEDAAKVEIEATAVIPD